MDIVKKYTPEELENFVGAIRSASAEIARANPSFYMISLTGGLPLFDILRIVDRNVDADKAIYFPTASRINRSAEVVTRCFENFFLEKGDETDEPRVIVNMDEVVSGGSVEKIVNAYNSASRKNGRYLAKMSSSSSSSDANPAETHACKTREKFPLLTFGIKEVRPVGLKMRAEYLNRVNRGEIREFPTGKIITMDDPDFETVSFKHPASSGFNGGVGYFPKIEKIILTEQYRELLRDVARISGVDPETVEPSRARVDSDCERYSRKPNYSD